jgi:hypothetical protein
MVAVRVCPVCSHTVPAALVVSGTDKMVCPNCGTPLTISLASRIIGGFIALGVGWLVWGYFRELGGEGAWVLPVVYTFLIYSAIYTLYLLFGSDLVKREAPPESEPAPVSAGAHGHGSVHH